MAQSARLRVLVVEDEFLIATEIAAILEDAGHDVMGPAGSLAAARALIAGERPDFAVIDANLRGESSGPLAHDLRTQAVPFCVCTGYRPADLRPQFGDVATLQKPVNPLMLVDLIATMVRA